MSDDPHLHLALWRYQIIASLLTLEGQRGQLKREIDRLAARDHQHPGQGPIRLGFGTIEHWYYDFKRDGLEGLKSVPRSDFGTSRRIDDKLAAMIEDIAREHPQLDGKSLLAELRVGVPETPLPSRSTFYRFLRARGLNERNAIPDRTDRRAYGFELPGDCWQGDVMYGPTLPAPDGRRRQTYLFALIDDASRLILHAQFYFEQHLVCLRDLLKQAFLKRGLPRRLYFDNGKIFRSHMLLLVAARLGIQLLHSRPYRPQGRAKVERWFGTARRSFLKRVDINRLSGLDELNRLLFAWVEGEYHVQPHRGIDGDRPLDRWVRSSEGVRPLPRDVDLDELFLNELERRVGKDGVFSLNSRSFEAGPRFIGRRIKVRFDPFNLRRVFVLEADGARLEVFPLDRSANLRVRRIQDQPVPAPDKRPLRSLTHLADSHAAPFLPKRIKNEDSDN
jgi:transposase InsO family protein